MNIITYHLYLLQLENYDLRRYLRVLRHAWLPPRRLRQKLVWTVKIKTVFALALVLQLVVALSIAKNILLAAIIFVAFSYAHGLFLALAVLIISPLDAFLKQRIITAAEKKLLLFPRLKIIAITGSYGKTTMKEVLAAIAGEQYTVLKTPDNINTPLGIARLIIEKLNATTDIFIVEMGAYQKGNIKKLCALAPPHISILTGINEAHLERFGSIEKTIAAKFEIVRYARPDATIILNADNEHSTDAYKRYVGAKPVLFYTARNNPLSHHRVENIRHAENGLHMSCVITPGNYEIKTALLGDYAAGTIMGAIIAAETLGISKEKIIQGIAFIKPISHRLEPIAGPRGILIIDDSYNGNPEGAHEAIRVLARFAPRRKIYLTPGLVETGHRALAVHHALGKELAAVADLVILIKNSATTSIAAGLAAAAFPSEKIMWFENALHAHAALAGILKSGDVILFQNDLPDNYY